MREGGETSPVGRPDFKSGEGRETVLGGFDSCLLRQPTPEHAHEAVRARISVAL